MRVEELVNCVFMGYSAVSLSMDNITTVRFIRKRKQKTRRALQSTSVCTPTRSPCGIAYGVRRFNQLAHIRVIQSEP